MTRRYTLPDPLPGESDADWCRRAAESIPAEELMRDVIAWLDLLGNKGLRRPAWARIMEITGNGSGIARAIAERFREPEEGGAT